MAQTKIIIATTGQTYNLPGTSWTATQVASQLSDSIPGLAAMTSTVTTDADGDNVITFTQRTGTKG